MGSILEVHLTLLNGGGLDPEGPLHWRHRTDYSGKNMMQLGIFNETIQRWLGDTTRVTAHARTFVTSRVDGESGERMSIEIPDSLGIFADMANGARCTYRVSAVTGGRPRSAFDRDLRHRRPHSVALRRHRRVATPRRRANRPSSPDPGTAHGWQVERDFIDSVRDGAPVTLTNFEDGVRYMRFTEAVWESWSEGRAVDVPALE